MVLIPVFHLKQQKEPTSKTDVGGLFLLTFVDSSYISQTYLLTNSVSPVWKRVSTAVLDSDRLCKAPMLFFPSSNIARHPCRSAASAKSERSQGVLHVGIDLKYVSCMEVTLYDHATRYYMTGCHWFLIYLFGSIREVDFFLVFERADCTQTNAI